MSISALVIKDFQKALFLCVYVCVCMCVAAEREMKTESEQSGGLNGVCVGRGGGQRKADVFGCPSACMCLTSLYVCVCV